MQFSSDAATIKAAIALLKQRNPQTKVRVCAGTVVGECVATVDACE